MTECVPPPSPEEEEKNPGPDETPPDGAESAAFFDVDGTLTRTNIVQYFVYFAQHGRSFWSRAWWTTGFLFRVPYYVLVDQFSRSRFNEVFYRNYRGWDAAHLIELGALSFSQLTRPRLYPKAVETIQRHQEQGHRVVLLTGTLDFIVAPLAEYLGVTDVMAAQLRIEAECATGQLTGPPLGGAEKARRVQQWAAQHDLDLAASFAYGDSSSDAPMLAAVGHPVAVNPSRGLRRIARERGWEIQEWSREQASE